MSVTVKVDGTFRAKIRNVKPEDVVLSGKNLSVQGVILPILPNRLYEAFFMLERVTRHKHGTLYLDILKSGDLKYATDTSDYSPDYYIGRVLGFGSNTPTFRQTIFASSRVPEDDEFLRGNTNEY